MQHGRWMAEIGLASCHQLQHNREIKLAKIRYSSQISSCKVNK